MRVLTSTFALAAGACVGAVHHQQRLIHADLIHAVLYSRSTR